MSTWRRARHIVCIIRLAQPKTDRIHNGLDIRYRIAVAWIGSEIRMHSPAGCRWVTVIAPPREATKANLRRPVIVSIRFARRLT